MKNDFQILWKWLWMHFNKNEKYTQYKKYEPGCRWCLCDLFKWEFIHVLKIFTCQTKCKNKYYKARPKAITHSKQYDFRTNVLYANSPTESRGKARSSKPRLNSEPRREVLRSASPAGALPLLGKVRRWTASTRSSALAQ